MTLLPIALLLLSPSLQEGAAADSPIAQELRAADASLDAIAALPDGERTFANTVEAIDDVSARFFDATQMTAFLAQVSTDPAERELGRRVAAETGDWYLKLTKRRDLFHALEVVDGLGLDLDAEEARLLELLLRDFRREGMDLGDEDRARLAEVDTELNRLGIDFRKNIADARERLLLAPEELAGLPESFLATLPRLGSLYDVAVDGPNVRRILQLCEVEATRLKTVVAWGLRAVPENVELLERLLRLRSEKAHLLGYETIADYETEVRMAGSAKAVWAFYDELRPKLRKKAEADFREYEDAKRRHTGDPEARLEAWDVSFYGDRLLRERYAVDSEAIRDYFSLPAVTQGLFDITQALYGLVYEDVTDEARAAGRPVWHDDVRLFRVSDKTSGEVLGEFYLDLFPRPGKYTHAAKFSIRTGKLWRDGTRSLPLVALVCNFTKPTADHPSLLSHAEVETLFHEFGHCLHGILGRTRFSYFAGTQVARDFVEAPSQMFENWVWDPGVLRTFARHYETGEPLPDALIQGLVAARNLGSGLSYEGQVYLGVLDMTYHTDPDGEVDTNAVRMQVYAETRLFEPLPVPSQASFGHLVGYEAGYYGYLWSLVYAQDMFGRFRELGLLSPEAGAAYRRAVLSRGGSVDELTMVRDFLGREPNSDAFLEHLGLSPEGEEPASDRRGQ